MTKNIQKSQELYLQALESDSIVTCKRLLIKAINLDPKNVDVLVYLADLEDDAEAAKLQYLRAIDVYESENGKGFFEDNTGVFWLNHGTRPFMRALAGLADCHSYFEEYQASIDIYQRMLKLNSDDNLGVRYPLSSLYLRMNQLDEFSLLIDRYEDDAMTAFLFNRALYCFMKGGRTNEADHLLAQAHQQNHHVIQFLLFKKDPPDENYIENDYVILGSEEEAISYVMENMDLWHRSQEVIAWLEDFIKPN
ncbi:tetratricopeptide repeat protein [Marinicella meishanensis]|uniref:tetratricopeptide repeat protein n=1 Tax=Marinicella meishanensis TaxID=2873263 RepID=UPI001CBE6206|nr:hypothetical protein [Marinicella sp. NBU2979]